MMDLFWPEEMEAFYERNKLKKGGSKGGKDMQGPQLRRFLQEACLKDLAETLGEEAEPWIWYLETIHNCYYSMVMKTLPQDYSYEIAFNDFQLAFDNVHDLWGLPETLKVHIVSDHVLEFFAIEGLSCWSTSEETGEACHKLYKRRRKTHKLDSSDVLGKEAEHDLRTGLNVHNLKSKRA